MRKSIFLFAAVSAFAAAAPAAAQYYAPQPYQGQAYPGQYGVDTSYDARIGQLQSRLDAGIQAGTIDPREAWRLRREMNDLAQLQQRYSYNGLSQNERSDLQRRMRAVRQDMRMADGGAWDRNERYGYDDRAYGYGPSAGAGAGYYGQGGPYEDTVVCENRGGVGGLVDSMFGRNCFRVGDRAPANLYGLPSEYRSLYRDGYGTYYRSDGRAIYEIDSRTNTVLSVHPLNR